MAQKYTSKDYGAWLDNNPDKKGTDEWITVQRAYEDTRIKEEFHEKWANAVNKNDKTEALSLYGEWLWEKARSMAVRGLGTAIGQVTGQRIAGKPGAMIGGAVAGGVSSAVDQLASTGQIKPGELMSDVFQGANIMRGSAANALANVGTEALRQTIDEKQISRQGLNEAAVAGVAGAKFSQGMTGTKNARVELAKYQDASFERLRKEGVVLNPGDIERPDVIGGRAITAIAGNEALYADASKRNQKVWQRMIREELDMPPTSDTLAFRPPRRNGIGALVDKGELAEKRAQYYAPYEEIKNLSDQARADLEAFKTANKGSGFAAAMASPQAKDLLVGAAVDIDKLKLARENMNAAYQRSRAGDTQAAIDFHAYKDQVDQLEAQLEDAAKVWGDKDLPMRLREARRKIAMSWAVENATTGYGTVDVAELVHQKQNGVPVTGKLADIVLFGESFDKNVKQGGSIGSQSIRGMALPYTVRNVAAGNPQGFFAAGVPVLGEGVRSFLLSEGMQNRFAQPMQAFINEDIAASAVRSGLLTSGRNNTEQRKPPYR